MSKQQVKHMDSTYLEETHIILDENSINQLKNSGATESTPSEITKDQYWYDQADMFNILRDRVKIEEVDIMIAVKPELTQSNTGLFSDLIENECNRLKNGDKKAAIMPLNLGGDHWTALAITKNKNNTLVFTYNDSLGGKIPKELENLILGATTAPQIVDLHAKQQWNGYDCGPITIDNLVKIANGEDITRVNQNTTTAYRAKLRQEHAKIIEEQQRREALQQQAQYPQLPPAPPPIPQVNQQQQQAQYQQLPPAPPPILQVNQQQQQFSPQQQTQQIPQKISIMAAVGNSLKDIVRTIKRNPIKSTVVGIIGTITIVGTGGAAIPLIATIGAAAIVGKVIKDVGKTIYNNWNANRLTTNKPSYKRINKKEFIKKYNQQQSQVNDNFIKNTPIKHSTQAPAPSTTPKQPKSSNGKQNVR